MARDVESVRRDAQERAAGRGGQRQAAEPRLGLQACVRQRSLCLGVGSWLGSQSTGTVGWVAVGRSDRSQGDGAGSGRRGGGGSWF